MKREVVNPHKSSPTKQTINSLLESLIAPTKPHEIYPQIESSMTSSTFEQQHDSTSHSATAAIPISGGNGNHHQIDSSLVNSPLIKDEEIQQSNQPQSLRLQQQQSLLAQQQQYLAQAAALSQSQGHSPHMNLSHSMSSIGIGGNISSGGLSLPSQKMSSAAMQQMSHAEKRANHNAIERARRENLNIRFLELAQSIPALLHVRKPSKSVIVSRSIEFIHETKQRLEVKTRSLQLLRQQNEEFKQEINRLRAKLGMNPVVFPDNIDLDLVFEANLEHARDHTPDISSHHNIGSHMRPHPIQTAGFGSYGTHPGTASPYSASFSRTGSPFDGIMSPLGQEDQDIELDSITASQQQYQNQSMHPMNAGVGPHQSSHSILDNSLQDINKPLLHGHPSAIQTGYGSYQSNQGFGGASSPSSASYPISMPTNSGSQNQSPLSSLHMNISAGKVSGNSGENNLSTSYSNSYSPMDINMAQRMAAFNQQQQQMNGSWKDNNAFSSGMKFQNNTVNQINDDMLQFIQQQQQ